MLAPGSVGKCRVARKTNGARDGGGWPESEILQENPDRLFRRTTHCTTEPEDGEPIMGTTRPNKDQIFHAAAELSDSDERLAFLKQACEGDSVLLEEIEELLEHDGAQDSLLDQSAPGLPPTVDQSITERPGTVIDRYKLLEQIGEGGIGMVFMAEQQKPIIRKVALKIIKPGMDTKEVIARFEAERQALALMDHPNIARVLDAGTTRVRPTVFRDGIGSGRPDHGLL